MPNLEGFQVDIIMSNRQWLCCKNKELLVMVLLTMVQMFDVNLGI